MDKAEVKRLIAEKTDQLREILRNLPVIQVKVIAATSLFVYTEQTSPGEMGSTVANILASLLLGFTTLGDDPEALEECLLQLMEAIKASMKALSDEMPPPRLQ